MRTTIEVTDRHRTRLLALAVARGEKGFSKLVEEAIERYLGEIDSAEREAAIRNGLEAIGSVSDEVAEKLECTFRDLRSSWR